MSGPISWSQKAITISIGRWTRFNEKLRNYNSKHSKASSGFFFKKSKLVGRKGTRRGVIDKSCSPFPSLPSLALSVRACGLVVVVGFGEERIKKGMTQKGGGGGTSLSASGVGYSGAGFSLQSSF